MFRLPGVSHKPPGLPVAGKPSEASLFQACLAGLADRLAAAFVFVVRGHVAHAAVGAALQASP